MSAERCSAADVLAITGQDPFLRSLSRYNGLRPAWRHRSAVAAVGRDAHDNPRNLAAIGPAADAAALVTEVILEVRDVPRLTLPRGGLTHLPRSLGVDSPSDWDFRSTVTPPVTQPGEERVGWLDETAVDDLKDLLVAANPETSTWPGEPKVRRWAGIWGAEGRLDACLADTSGAGGVGHFSAISTRPETRGQGLGSAITAWATRRLFEEGRDIITLGMYADNAVARRVYDRLGFTDDHRFTSAVVVNRGTATQRAEPGKQATCPE